jgi:hypothetical protein
MERILTWPNDSRPDPDQLAAAMVDDAVTAIRNRGHTRRYAVHVAARELGLRVRRVRSLLYGYPVTLLDEELAEIRGGYLRHLDAEMAHLSARLAAARERLRRMSEDDP